MLRILFILQICVTAIIQSALAERIDSNFPTRIAFGSCLDQDKPAPILDLITLAKPDLLILLGDNVYGNKGGVVDLQPAYQKLFAREDFTRLMARTRLLGVWDDNDYGPPDSGIENPQKDSAKKIFLEYFGAGKKDTRLSHPGVYASYYFGGEKDRLQVILLDTRTFRAALERMPAGSKSDTLGPYLPHQDGAGTILGEAQWSWLEAELEKPASFRILASSIQVISDNHGFEKWGNFPHERERLLNLLSRKALSPLIIISGDRHFSSLVKFPSANGNPIYEATSSSLNLVRGFGDGPNPYLVGAEVYDENFGMLEISMQGDGPAAQVKFISSTNQTKLNQRLVFE